MKRALILMALGALLAGCSGEKPVEGDNPTSSNAVSSDQSPRSKDRGAPPGAAPKDGPPTQTKQIPTDMKSR
jgi:hypothetical protein